jgi:hypothetical protein
MGLVEMDSPKLYLANQPVLWRRSKPTVTRKTGIIDEKEPAGSSVPARTGVVDRAL